MIKMGRIKLKNPIIASSGALAFGRGYGWERPLLTLGFIKPGNLGAVITKTLTANMWVGNYRGWNPWQVLRPLKGGWVNALGLTNKGIDWFIEHELKYYRHDNLIVSITDPKVRNIVAMAGKLDQYKLMAIEINLSCPNTHDWDDLQRSAVVTETLLKGVASKTGIPIIAKIGFLTIKERERLCKVFLQVNIEAVDMINTVPFNKVYPDSTSPLKFGGGVSGRLIKNRSLEQVSWFRENFDLPIIGGGGAETIEDVDEFLAAGARAVAIGSAHIVRPWVTTNLSKKIKNRK